VDCGGEDFGVAAYHARVMLTLRGEIASEYTAVKRTLADYVEHRAKKYGLECKIDYCDIFPPTQNNADCVKHLISVCEENNLSIIKPSQPFRWSEDFGFYTQGLKGCFFGIGDGEEYPALHTQRYDFPDDILEVAVDVLSNLVRS
jgi:metal-dependent amidase/aminoacylase/carboxypeptidase family protein